MFREYFVSERAQHELEKWPSVRPWAVVVLAGTGGEAAMHLSPDGMTALHRVSTVISVLFNASGNTSQGHSGPW